MLTRSALVNQYVAQHAGAEMHDVKVLPGMQGLDRDGAEQVMESISYAMRILTEAVANV